MVGWLLGSSVGNRDGIIEGCLEGFFTVGIQDGCILGSCVGALKGAFVGNTLGCKDGGNEGYIVGNIDGRDEGGTLKHRNYNIFYRLIITIIIIINYFSAHGKSRQSIVLAF